MCLLIYSIPRKGYSSNGSYALINKLVNIKIFTSYDACNRAVRSQVDLNKLLSKHLDL